MDGSDEPYDLICLDIMMPEMNGHTALKEIRSIEYDEGRYGADGIKVIMATALDDKVNIIKAFREQTDADVVKPIE